jgi:hypothetical protein
MDVVVDDRLFVVGLCELSRDALSPYEVTTLLPRAEAACRTLAIEVSAVAIEGYYSESPELERFFTLVRALQRARMPSVAPGPGADAIHFLRRVFCSPAMGRVADMEHVIPRASSPFGQALREARSWSVATLCEQARALVGPSDAGLVAVASATADPIALCVARETVALSADVEFAEPEPPNYVWVVSGTVAQVAARYVAALAETTGITLPDPVPTSAARYGGAGQKAELNGRCILVGEQPASEYPFYHWYVDARGMTPVVIDFWSSHVWSTDTLRNSPARSWPRAGAQVAGPLQ